MKSEYKQKLLNIKAFVFDVDGVLTNGGLIIHPDGKFIRQMNAKDGYAIKLAIKQGYTIGVITGGREQNIKIRLENLGIKEVFLGIHDKLPVLKKFLKNNNLKKENIIYMGDDIPDLKALQHVGLSCCPSDAAIDVQKICNYISPKRGGEGCVRDIIEQTLRLTNKWNLDGKIKY